jgi:hypothetical protein
MSKLLNNLITIIDIAHEDTSTACVISSSIHKSYKNVMSVCGGIVCDVCMFEEDNKDKINRNLFHEPVNKNT